MSVITSGRTAPHPRDLGPLLGSGPKLRTDLLQTFIDGWRECGDVVWYRGPRPMYVVAHPDLVQHVMQDHYEGHYPRSQLVRSRLQDTMGEGIFRSGGEFWRRQHAMVHPAFEQQWRARLPALLNTATAEMLRRWDAVASGDGRIDIVAEMMRLSLDVVGELMLGDDWARHGAAIRTALHDANEFAIPRVTGFPTPVERMTPAYKRFRRATDTIESVTMAAITARRAMPRDDVLSAYLEATADGSGDGMTDAAAYDEVRTAFFGAYKGLAYALTWTWYLLSQHPAWDRRLREQLDGELGGEPPGIDDLARVPDLAMVIAEALRLYPPLYVFSRPPVEDEIIAGYRIPADVLLLVIPYITHRHPSVWENAEAFDPTRFTPERARARHPFAYLPFGAGPRRRCVAEDYSMVHLQLVVATVAQRFRLALAPGQKIVRKPEFLLRPSQPLIMTLESAGT